MFVKWSHFAQTHSLNVVFKSQDNVLVKMGLGYV